MKYYILTVSLFLCGPTLATNIPLTDGSVDTDMEVTNLNNQLGILHNGKLDLKPGNVLPKTSSRYTLGSANAEWAAIYVDTITASSMTITAATIPTLTLTTIACGSSNAIDIDSKTLYINCSTNRVSIGTTTADGPLHIFTGSAGSVTAGGNADDLIIESNTTAGLSFLTTASDSQYIYFGDAADNDVGSFLYNHPSNYLAITVNASERMRITSSGAVGIGEDTPLGKLHVKTADAGGGTIDTGADEFVIENGGNAGLTVLTGTTDIGRMVFADTGGNERGGFQYHHADDLLRLLSAGNTAVEIEGDRNVHINPSGTADVNLEVSDFGSTGGGTVHAASYASHSERELKDNIVYLTQAEEQNALNDIASMKHVRFRYKRINPNTGNRLPSLSTDTVHVGLVFEEAPQSIKGKANDIALEKRIALLEMAIKQLLREVEALQTRVTELEKN